MAPSLKRAKKGSFGVLIWDFLVFCVFVSGVVNSGLIWRDNLWVVLSFGGFEEFDGGSVTIRCFFLFGLSLVGRFGLGYFLGICFSGLIVIGVFRF